MPSDVSVVVADVCRIASVREGLHLPGRMMHFSTGSLASAIESIKTYQAKVVAVDALFAQTPSGAAFVDRVDALPVRGTTVRLIVQHDGRWVTTPRSDGAIGTQGPGVSAPPPAVAAAPKSPLVTPPPALVAPVSTAAAIAAQMAAVNTRRAPRFLVRNPLEAVVESGRASLIDLSALGAQIVSEPTLRPNQKIKIALPDTDDVLNVVAQVAWSTFEMAPSSSSPHYRAGVEFTDAAKHALEEYRRRHCADQPLKLRS
jgi:PilZ domain-containing protein